MDIANTLFVGVYGHVAAVSKLDGSLIWKKQLKGSFLSVSDPFVNVLVEGQRIYAHSNGELFCLDAATGRKLWNNKLKGLGYSIASLAVEGATTPSQAALAHHRRGKSSADTGGGEVG